MVGKKISVTVRSLSKMKENEGEKGEREEDEKKSLQEA